MGAKMKAKKFKNEMIIEPMSERYIENMKMVVRLKFDQHEALRSKLKITGNHVLIENIGNRDGARHLFWGMKKVNGEWIGQNNMGKILMDLREQYKREDQASDASKINDSID